MLSSNRHILVTGANGFIGKNLIVHLNENSNIHLTTFVRGDDIALLPKMISQVDAIVHLAGENRPADEAVFHQVNYGLTSVICQVIEQELHSSGRRVPLIFASSTQADYNNSYGRSKLAAEVAVQKLANEKGIPTAIFRLPGVFGKWCKPNYNSVVATFCYNIARDLPVHVNEHASKIRLVYVDDVVKALLAVIESPMDGIMKPTVLPEFEITPRELFEQIRSFGNCRDTLVTERVGNGFVRALYATYISYLPCEKFSYELKRHIDKRGLFVEILKTHDSGQFSYFTALPGIVRGGHYHHTKSEKFLVIKGEALFRFRHLITNELFEQRTNGNRPQIVDTIPGWSHDITNVGDDEMLVLLWANEIFDRENQDTVASKVLE